jgi:hypothetical protein
MFKKLPSTHFFLFFSRLGSTMEPTAVTAAPVSSSDPFVAEFSTAASVSQFITINESF